MRSLERLVNKVPKDMLDDNLKDSGTEWIGGIPQSWKIAKLGSLYTLRNQKVSDKEYPPLSVTMKGVVPQLETAAKTVDGDNRKLVRMGDFVINSRSDRRGSCGISQYDGSVSLINTILTPRGRMHPGYYNWLFHTSLFADEFYKWGHGIVDDLWTTRWQEMKHILVPVPPFETQESIASYLDKYCAKIDSIIGEAQASIEEYTEWKASIIYEAVTKGLDPDVKMKDSRIEGIGTIPATWQITRFIMKNYVRARLGWKGLKAEEYVDNGYPFLSAYNILNNHIRWENLNYITKERFDESPEIKISVGDILLVKDGAGIGKCARIDELPLGEATVNSSLSVITPDSDIYYRYEYYYFLSPTFQSIISRLTNGMGVPHLTQEAMKNIYLPLPTLPEQIKIADYLDDKIAEIDTIIYTKEKLIADLESYRKSLIYEIVTGKRRVI